MAAAPSDRTKIHSVSYLEDIQLNVNWEDVSCPICLDFPHNGVLLLCSSYDKGCRPFICDTDQTHSNCLNRLKNAYKMSSAPKDSPTSNFAEAFQVIPSSPSNLPTCPLCRGDVTGWVAVDEARTHLDMKRRCCEEKNCSYVGNFLKLKEHARIKHPHSCPSEIDPAHQLDWENFQQSSEIIDVLSTIHAEVPHGVVLGDYVIEYGGDETGGDEFDDFRRHEGNWWTSCILYKVFGNFKALRNRRRSRRNSTRRVRRQSSFEASSLDEGSPSSIDISEYRFDETYDDFFGMDNGHGATSRGVVSRHSWRQRSRFYDT